MVFINELFRPERLHYVLQFWLICVIIIIVITWLRKWFRRLTTVFNDCQKALQFDRVRR